MCPAPDAARRALERSRRLVLGELVDRNARLSPDKVALVFEGETRTFAQLRERTDRLAQALAARGVRRGDNVAVLLYNRFEVVESFLACQKLGACPVPVNFRLVEAELDYVLRDSRSVGLISDPNLATIAAAAYEAIDSLRFHLAVGDERAADSPAEPFEVALMGAPATPPDTPVDEDDLAFLMYTSGTTGRPKGAMLTHQNMVANTLNWVHELEARRDDVWLSGLPLFHIGGVNGVLPFLYLGATCVITPSTNFDPVRSIELLREHDVTMCFFVPTQWTDICGRPEIADIDVSRLRKAMWGASQAPRSTLERMGATFPNVDVINAFGQTEMSSNTAFLKGADSVRKMGSVGRPAINVELRIVDDGGRDVTQGQVGELVYRGPTVMKGYFDNPDATDEAFAGGWFHGGDLGYADDEGFIYVVDRKKDMIISGGENIYPAEVERALLEHPAVAEAAVIGIAHPRWVETPLAVIVPAPGAEPDQEELRDHCRVHLAGYKKPSSFVFVDALPRNATGKVLKRELRERYGDRFAPAG